MVSIAWKGTERVKTKFCVLILAAVVSLSACATKPATLGEPEIVDVASDKLLMVWSSGGTYSAVQRFVDEEAGVVCYIYYRGISCLPVDQTNLERSQ